MRLSNEGYLVLPTFGASAEAVGAADVFALLDFEASGDAAMLSVLVAFALCVVVFLVDFLVDLAFLWLGWVDVVAALLMLAPVSAFAAGAGAAAGAAAAGAAVCAAAVSETANALASSALNNLVIVCPQFELNKIDTVFCVAAINAPIGLWLTRASQPRRGVAGRQLSTGHRRLAACSASTGSGSTATGCVTADSSGRSLWESLKNHD